MKQTHRLGLRLRLALALAAVAFVSVALATVLANRGLDSRLHVAAHERSQTAAHHSAALAAGIYRRERRWSPAVVTQLRHLGHMNGYLLTVFDASGRRLSPPVRGESVRSTVRVDGRSVGSIEIAQLSGKLLTAEDRSLHAHLNNLHLLAGVLAVAFGLVAAALIAPQLARPLRRLTETARRIELGDLDARAAVGGGTEFVSLGGAINRLAETLKREEEIRRDAATDIAHELRTPIGGMLSRIEAAQDGIIDDERANLAAMHAEALRLTRFVDDLGRLAEAQLPGMLLTRSDVDLEALAWRRIVAFREYFEANDIELVEEITAAAAFGDEKRLEQVLDNLLSNALRYTDSGGTVAVTVRKHDDEALLEVADTGMGISAEDLPHVFERFWRGDKSRSRATGGYGIGLAVVSELVRAHDGRIDVESEPGRGSRFSVYLPTAERPGA